MHCSFYVRSSIETVFNIIALSRLQEKVCEANIDEMLMCSCEGRHQIAQALGSNFSKFDDQTAEITLGIFLNILAVELHVLPVSFLVEDVVDGLNSLGVGLGQSEDEAIFVDFYLPDGWQIKVTSKMLCPDETTQNSSCVLSDQNGLDRAVFDFSYGRLNFTIC